LQQWADLATDAQNAYDKLDVDHQAAFFEMILHPILGGQIVHKVNIGAEKNMVYANQHRNSANDVLMQVLSDFNDDGSLTTRWDNILDGKWARMLDRKTSVLL
jgi:hypothetical protein